ncbi:MAG: response regulator [Syntrophales bacterium LBB04]|nr:response regulator [Syntrophales bacterium LBB04]
MKRILVVEDDILLAETIRFRLEDLGFEVSGMAMDGEEAIRKVETLRPDLVLMDIQLESGMDGIEATKRIRERFDFPVIYLTAHGDEETFNRAKGTDPHSYLLKPVRDLDLNISIEMAFYRYRLESNLKDRIRELNWLYSLSELIGKGSISPEEIFQGIVNLIPPAWQYPEITYARLVLSGREYKTGNYCYTPWNMVTAIYSLDKPIGFLEVGYLEDRSSEEMDNFQADEKRLFENIAQRTGKVFERIKIEKDLKTSQEQYRQLVEGTANKENVPNGTLG